MKKGFTLIELLAVVLIIGILTAVALLLSLLRLRGACGFSAEKALRCKFFPLQTEAIRLYYGRKNLNRSNFYDRI